MVRKLAQLPARTVEPLEHMACLGSTAELSLLSIISGRAEPELHAELLPAVRAGLITCLEASYKFLHDRIREAVYSRIPEELRAAAHLRIGRLLLSRLSAPELAERIFEVANQLNHSTALIAEPQERESLCRLNLQAGRRAKSSIAYASARGYLLQAAALLPADAWSTRYEDTFALYLELSECEYLCGGFQAADELFTMLLGRTSRASDRARVYSLRMRHYLVSGRCAEGAGVAIEALGLFGVQFPPSDDEVEAAFAAEHEEIKRLLRGRRIADLALAPVVTDPDVRAILSLLVDAMPCFFLARPKMFGLLVTKVLRFSLQYGNTEESCAGYTGYGIMLVAIFADIAAGLEFSELSLVLNEKFDDRKRRGMFLHVHGNLTFWRKHIAACLPILERAFVACQEVGDLVMAGHCAFGLVWHLLEKGDPLGEVLAASRRYAAFASHSHNGAVYQTIRLEQQLVVELQGDTFESSGLEGAPFDEAAAVEEITRATFGGGLAVHHVIKQLSAFLFGRPEEALEAAARAAEVVATVLTLPVEATHHFYLALTLAALHPQAPPARQRELAQRLEAELAKLKLWADSCPANALCRYALVAAEAARIEHRELDAERLYEQAIGSAAKSGFVQIEALACELASRFYRGRGFDAIADLYLREARTRYARWGADGKVKQLDRLRPDLVERRAFAPTVTLAVGAERLDVLSVVKASQAISGEIVLDSLLRKLITIVLEQAGAQKGYVLLARDGSLVLLAEGLIDEQGTSAVRLLDSLPAACSPLLPASIVAYVGRTRQKVLLPDAAEAPAFCSDAYVVRTRPRSILCLPIIKQQELIGLLYLENNLMVGAFTVEQIEVLELLAAQAAISLESAYFLAKEQAAREAAEAAERRMAFLSEASELLGESLDYEQVLVRLASLSLREFADSFVIDVVEDGALKRIAWMHADPAKQALLEELSLRYPPTLGSAHPTSQVIRTGEPLLIPADGDRPERITGFDEEYAQLARTIGTRTALAVPLVAHGKRIGAITFGSGRPGQSYGRADLELARELAHRIALAIENARLHRQTVQALRLREEFLSVASHELRTPMTALTLALQIMSEAQRSGRMEPTAMRRFIDLALVQGQRLNRLIDELLEVSRIQMDKLRISRVEVDLIALVTEVVQRFELNLTQSGSRVAIHSAGPVVGSWDPSRLEQVVTNLLSNAIKFGAGKPIEIRIEQGEGIARLIVKDSGIGMDPAVTARIFEPFERAVSARHYGGLGLGLFISRSIVEAHGGSIGVESQPGAGAIFTVELPL
jgi:signal transduction histidine kinase